MWETKTPHHENEMQNTEKSKTIFEYVGHGKNLKSLENWNKITKITFGDCKNRSLNSET